ncbi:MAG: tRNA uridine-5-carboxymethylaminomethyl(34) synthesis GTPase MnmE [Lachnospiraceae bacterium]|nr:tRNA uridine-5-carboxymethylaminomethyl(34) synthesis GTPase MnmE [Lachnospiraceae bacterium]
MIHTDTIAAIATGMNTAGIGIIRISGDDSFSVIRKIFRTPSGAVLNEIESHRVIYGYIYDEEQMIDEVLLIPMRAPRSFTREDTVEIDCHGGLLLMQKILATVLKNGARAAEPGEFTKRAFLNGRIDLSKAEAVIDLINAQNDYAMQNSLKHLTGKLYEILKDCKDKILYETAYIESALDDPEHYDLTGYPQELRKKIGDITDTLLKLTETFHDGQIISEGIKTVILGKPNVGKSSFLNTLLGQDIAIVTEIAGTTRDSLKEHVMIDGISLDVIDTAGIHETDDPVESIGVDRARKLAESADLILMIIDASAPLTEADLSVFQIISEKKALILLNKSDLPAAVTTEEIRKHSHHPILQISAKEETGFDDFKSFIREEFIKGFLTYNNEIFISDQRQYQLLTDSVKSLQEVCNSIDQGLPEDFYTIDLTNAYEDLCLITGEHVNDDLISEIFAKFCTGK